MKGNIDSDFPLMTNTDSSRLINELHIEAETMAGKINNYIKTIQGYESKVDELTDEINHLKRNISDLNERDNKIIKSILQDESLFLGEIFGDTRILTIKLEVCMPLTESELKQVKDALTYVSTH